MALGEKEQLLKEGEKEREAWRQRDQALAMVLQEKEALIHDLKEGLQSCQNDAQVMCTHKGVIPTWVYMHAKPGKPDPLTLQVNLPENGLGTLPFTTVSIHLKIRWANHSRVSHMGRALCNDSLKGPKTAASVRVRSS